MLVQDSQFRKFERPYCLDSPDFFRPQYGVFVDGDYRVATCCTCHLVLSQAHELNCFLWDQKTTCIHLDSDAIYTLKLLETSILRSPAQAAPARTQYEVQVQELREDLTDNDVLVCRRSISG